MEPIENFDGAAMLAVLHLLPDVSASGHLRSCVAVEHTFRTGYAILVLQQQTAMFAIAGTSVAM